LSRCGSGCISPQKPVQPVLPARLRRMHQSHRMHRMHRGNIDGCTHAGRVNRNTLFEVVAGVRFLAWPELDLHLDGVLTPCKTALLNKEN